MIIISEETLDIFRRKTNCEWCGRYVPRCDPHHYWFKRGIGGGSRLDHIYNLVGLCRGWVGGRFVSCHDLAEQKKITRRQLLVLVAKRENVLEDWLEDELYRLWRTPGK